MEFSSAELIAFFASLIQPFVAVNTISEKQGVSIIYELMKREVRPKAIADVLRHAMEQQGEPERLEEFIVPSQGSLLTYALERIGPQIKAGKINAQYGTWAAGILVRRIASPSSQIEVQEMAD